MPRDLVTEQELLSYVVTAFNENPVTAGWRPTGLHQHAEDADGCNWDISHINCETDDADEGVLAMAAGSEIIGDLRARYNLQ
jgi:hypothetical protein